MGNPRQVARSRARHQVLMIAVGVMALAGVRAAGDGSEDASATVHRVHDRGGGHAGESGSRWQGHPA